MVFSGCKSPIQIYMNNRDDDLNVSFRVKVDDYFLFATSAQIKCFGCGEAGHLIRGWPGFVRLQGAVLWRSCGGDLLCGVPV